MAVHSHAFRPYTGPRTAAWARPLVLTRYALRDAFAQKKTIALLVLSAIPTLAAAVIIYLHHNLEAVKILEIPIDAIVKIDSQFFLRILWGQALAAFLLTVVTGPRMLVSDLRDKAEYYLAHGGRLVWLVYPRQKLVEVYAADTDVAILTENDVLTGGDVLTGFELPVRDIFAVDEPIEEGEGG